MESIVAAVFCAVTLPRRKTETDKFRLLVDGESEEREWQK
jgi:hypothetical protein